MGLLVAMPLARGQPPVATALLGAGLVLLAWLVAADLATMRRLAAGLVVDLM